MLEMLWRGFRQTPLLFQILVGFFAVLAFIEILRMAFFWIVIAGAGYFLWYKAGLHWPGLSWNQKIIKIITFSW